jgi:HD-GYP domain-containing protein (c-di-GMP phosphodiesterase class II)
MTSKKYIIIDKNIISDGISLSFDIFSPTTSKLEMNCVMIKNSIITIDEKSLMKQTEALYVEESEHHEYKTYYKTYLEHLSKSQNVSFDDETKGIYHNAAKLLFDFFNNPQERYNYETCKKIVNDLVTTVVCEDFTIKSMVNISTNDYYTHTHSLDVAIYSLSLGSCLGLDKNALLELGEAALLFDIGKSKIDPNIINKKGKLTKREFEEIKHHSMLGYSLALKMGIKNRNILAGIKHHHEKMDGTGYPCGLKGDGIPLFARIIGLCDIFDAITSKRSYRDAMLAFDAIKLMKLQMKNHIDLKLLNSMIEMFR